MADETTPQAGMSATGTAPAEKTHGGAMLHGTGLIDLGDFALGTEADLRTSEFTEYTVEEEVPKTWVERATKAWEYYNTEGLVANIVSTWLAFAIGDDVKPMCADPETQKKAEAFFRGMKLGTWVKDQIVQLLVKGDMVGYLVYTKDGKIEEVRCLNPLSVLVHYESDKLAKAVQFKKPIDETSKIDDSEAQNLELSQLLHMKWQAPPFSPRGNSMVLPAFKPLSLYQDYRKAERAIAKRWTTPLRFIQVGGQFGNHLIMPNQKQLKDIRNLINKMDLRSGLVVPFYVKAETYGTEGHVLETEKKVAETKEDVVVALGLAKSLVTGDGPNFATASISLKKMIIMLRTIRSFAREALEWIFNAWKNAEGLDDLEMTFEFAAFDLDDENEFKKLLIDLYDKGVISRRTLQKKMSLTPSTEEENMKSERLIDSADPKDIVALVQVGVLPVEEAQRLLGLSVDKAAEQQVASDRRQLRTVYEQKSELAMAGKYCDGCANFDESRNWCLFHDNEVSFGTPACPSFAPKGSEAEQFLPDALTAVSGNGADPHTKDGDCGCGKKH